MNRIRRWLVAAVGLPVNAITGPVALCLLLLILAARVAAPVHRLGPPLGRAAQPGFQVLARWQRAWSGRVLGRPILASEDARLTGRDLGWLAVHAITGPACLAMVALMLSTLDVISKLQVYRTGTAVILTLSLSMIAIGGLSLVAAAIAGRVQARLTELLLGPGTSSAERIRQLTASRAAAVDAQAAELRRIERDLHDGAQARLIAVRMTLGLARSSADPRTRELIDEAWESAGQALTDLRDLVRGIHPPVLADRGLSGAIQAATLLCPVPVETDLDLPGRPEAPVESALYFATVEALSNIAKHSHARHAWVRLRHARGTMRLTVGDDGHGGANPSAGSGLHGIGRRLSAFDGTLTVHSPPGGPSVLTMELPCALSSPKTSPSCGTG